MKRQKWTSIAQPLAYVGVGRGPEGDLPLVYRFSGDKAHLFIAEQVGLFFSVQLVGNRRAPLLVRRRAVSARAEKRVALTAALTVSDRFANVTQ
jgi:hypothetical protein